MYGWWPGYFGGKEYFDSYEKAKTAASNFGL
jgi:hypothetical protein